MTVYRTTGDSVISTRSLIRDNISNAKNLTTHKLRATRYLLDQAKVEAARTHPRIKTCILDQSLTLGKICPRSFLSCGGNFTTVASIRNDLLRLENVALELVQSCSRLKPLGSERESLRKCVQTKLADLSLQLSLLEKKFVDGIKRLVNVSTDCVMKETGEISAKIGAVEGAIKNCKNF
jgi:hypothetical protein